MSNRVYIETLEIRRTYAEEKCIAIEAHDDNEAGTVSIGLMENIGDLGVDLENDLSILQYCWKNMSDRDEEDVDVRTIASIIDYLVESERGVTINGTFYDWEEIKSIFS